jgi:surface protein
MFYGCSKLTSLDLSNFNASKVTGTSYMFNGCTSVTTAYGRNEADVNKYNSSYAKPTNVIFTVK